MSEEELGLLSQNEAYVEYQRMLMQHLQQLTRVEPEQDVIQEEASSEDNQDELGILSQEEASAEFQRMLMEQQQQPTRVAPVPEQEVGGREEGFLILDLREDDLEDAGPILRPWRADPRIAVLPEEQMQVASFNQSIDHALETIQQINSHFPGL